MQKNKIENNNYYEKELKTNTDKLYTMQALSTSNDIMQVILKEIYA